MRCVTIKWLVDDADGYTDQLPIEDFARMTEGAERVHLVIGPRGGRHHARCRLVVREKSARLDYREFKEFNSRHGMKPGVLVLSFRDGMRTEISGASWDDEIIGSDEATISIEDCETVNAILQEATDRTHRLSQRLLRPKQSALYAELERTYGGRCAISGCPVPFALEAAHLIPVSGSGSDSPTNAILLRSDLHSLLDANQAAIHPETATLYLSEEARAWRDYAKLHGKARLADPELGFAANKPNAGFLKERWDWFTSEHGDPFE